MTPGSSALAHARSLLPASFSPSRLTPRQFLALGGGLGCSAWSYAGMYPQFDQGDLRIVLALTSLGFGALVSSQSVKARTAFGAFGRALAMAAALGVASAFLPLLFLGGHPIGIFFGAIFGVPTGMIYGVPLGILAAAAHRGSHSNSSDGTDLVARAAGIWLAPMALVGLVFTLVVDYHRQPFMDEPAVITHLPLALPAVFAGATALVGVIVTAVAMMRMRARRQFVARVAAGEEPMYRVRAVSDDKPLDDALSIGAGQRVVEWMPDGAAPNAYRTMAAGVPVAVID